MLGLLHDLVEKVNERGHLVSLLQNARLSVNFHTEDETGILTIENGRLNFGESSERMPDVFISGNKSNIASLLLGKEKLRRASENNVLQLKATYRQALFLESLLLLSNTNLKEETEISK